MPTHPDLRALEVVYRYRLDDVSDCVEASALGAHGRAPRRGRDDRLARGDQPLRPTSAFPDVTTDALENARPPGRPRDLERAALRRGARAAPSSTRSPASTTGALFYEFLGREIARAHRYERYVSVIVFDLDDFKRINDRIGHLDGDAVLVEVAERVRGVVRATDIPCRVGGDEFAVILPESSRDDAELLADRIALAIRGQKIEKIGALKISAGVAELRPEDTRRRPVQARRRRAATAPRTPARARIVAS